MNVLVVAPHMDDETLGPGATVAKHVAQGDRVTVCVVAHRVYNHEYNREVNEEELADCRAAQRVLGYQDLRFLDLPDERLEMASDRIIIPLESLVQEVQPGIVYVNHRSDVHQDHRAVFWAAMVVCRSQVPWGPSRICSYEVPSSTDHALGIPDLAFVPNHYVDVTAFLDRKLEALGCYKREARPFPHPRSPEGVRALATKRGTEMATAAAEAFIILRDFWR